jgi:two-component system chemotaxis response regulator CheB
MVTAGKEGGGMRVLVVDGSISVRSMVVRMLQALGMECQEAKGMEQVREAFAADERPALVVVGRHLADGDGLEMTRQVRQNPAASATKFIMISSDDDRARVDEAIAAGVDEYLVKPFTAEALAGALGRLGIRQAAAPAPAREDRIRVLVVDDSATIRSLITATLNKDPELKVVGAAVNGQMAVDMVRSHAPEIVLLDVEMPVLDGLGALREIRRSHPRLPVIMFSSLTERGAAVTLDALLAGANDYAAKPAGLEAADIVARIEEELVAKIKAIARRGRRPGQPPGAVPPALAATARGTRVDGVVIAVSTGGPTALAEILPHFAAAAAVPVLIVQHMPASFTPHLADRLGKVCGTAVREAPEGAMLKGGDVLLAPGGRHITVAGDRSRPRVQLSDAPQENACRPSADVLFRTAAKVWGAGTLGVVLTGMGRDGLAGARAVVEAGGEVLAQDEPTSVVWGMPGEVVKAGLAAAVLPLGEIGPEIQRRLKRVRS